MRRRNRQFRPREVAPHLDAKVDTRGCRANRGSAMFRYLGVVPRFVVGRVQYFPG